RAQRSDERPEARAVRIEGAPPAIDGRLDDPAWDAAPVLTGLVQKIPDEGEPATESTELRFLYDDEALYVAARMRSDDPSAIQAPVSRRDETFQSEQILIALDTFLDRRTAYAFGVTPSGVRLDRFHPRDAEHPSDRSWDPVWEARARVGVEGWTAEMRIPFSQLRFEEAVEQVWGLNVNRWVPKRNEDAFWVMVPESETGYASRFGTLVGIEGIAPKRGVEVTPYVAGNLTMTAEPDPDDPFAEESDGTMRVGGDVKIGLGPNLTLDAAINPDFGQVEADPAEVNLSAFETFFPERRPFFLEGAEVFDTGRPAYFYSRRIGASPSGSTPGDFADVPSNTTILGAAKLTGRLGPGLSIGVLAAATAEERARTYDLGEDRFDTVEVEPFTGYGVARVQKQFGPDQSTAGVVLTGVRRDLEAGTGLEALLPRQAISGGADWNLRFRDGEYEIEGDLGFSHVTGDTAAILRLQRSSARYYQRPDADHVELDPSRTALSGFSAGLGIERNSGEHWLWEAGVSARSPGFEINDLGRLRRTDEIDARARLTLRETRPGSFYRSWGVHLIGANEWNFDGTNTGRGVELEGNLRFLNYWQAELEGSMRFRAMSDRLTRGGPLMETGRGWSVRAGLENSWAAATRVGVEARYGESETGEQSVRVGGRLSLRPGPRWRLSFEPSWETGTDPRQYVATFDRDGEATFGRRYLFAFIDRTTISTRLRLDYTVQPGLTLEAYAEPFAASGRYYAFGELAEAGGRRLRTFGETPKTGIEETSDGVYAVSDGDDSFEVVQPDFNVRSFRSNLVLRWEWTPGSTLFLVWQQDRSASTERSEDVGFGDVWDSFDAAGDNFLALKATYWLPLGN
ncbi:MAG: DUF5916 domain-containing protein, partial [Gemmatimonadota bacterium]|nr:DUF5916 domain-containing protein [Gemmatimonadota bacterium]